MVTLSEVLRGTCRYPTRQSCVYLKAGGVGMWFKKRGLSTSINKNSLVEPFHFINVDKGTLVQS